MGIVTGIARIAAAESPADPSAVAQEAQRAAHAARFSDKPVQLELLMGVGTTVGELGFAGDVNVDDRLALGAGIGGGVFGPVWELHARARPYIAVTNFGRTLQALTFEAAFSRGKYAHFDDPLDLFVLSECGASSREIRDSCYRPEALPHQTSFAQFELGWEERTKSGFMLRASAGAASALYIATPQDCSDGGKPAGFAATGRWSAGSYRSDEPGLAL